MPRIEEVPLGFSSLSELDDGRIDRLVRKHIARVATDCIDRPGDKTKRKITIDINVEPVPDPDTGECEQTNVEIEVKSKVPTYRSKKYQMRVGKGGLLFNRDFPDEIDQMPLYGESDE